MIGLRVWQGQSRQQESLQQNLGASVVLPICNACIFRKIYWRGGGLPSLETADLFAGFSVATTPSGSYGDFQLFLVEEDPTRTDIGIFAYMCRKINAPQVSCTYKAYHAALLGQSFWSSSDVYILFLFLFFIVINLAYIVNSIIKCM